MVVPSCFTTTRSYADFGHPRRVAQGPQSSDIIENACGGQAAAPQNLFRRSGKRRRGAKKRTETEVDHRKCLLLACFLVAFSPERAQEIREPSWGRLGAILGPSWAILGPSWGCLGALGAVLGPSWGRLGPSWGRLGALGAVLGPSWGRLGAVLGPSWGEKSSLEDRSGPAWGHLGPFRSGLRPS